VIDEVVWNDGTIGTGGISDAFPVPAYQSGLALPPSVNDGKLRRGVPDVAAAASGRPGYRIVLNGTEIVKDGTSAVAPLWAGLIAMANAARGGRSVSSIRRSMPTRHCSARSSRAIIV
jgi:kumamolisin